MLINLYFLKFSHWGLEKCDDFKITQQRVVILEITKKPGLTTYLDLFLLNYDAVLMKADQNPTFWRIVPIFKT